MKKKVKQKKTLLNKYYAGTGGGGPPTNDLDQEDEKILQLLPAVSVSGDPNISESAVTFVFETSDFEVKNKLDGSLLWWLNIFIISAANWR